jgi:hypothetical protein
MDMALRRGNWTGFIKVVLVLIIGGTLFVKKQYCSPTSAKIVLEGAMPLNFHGRIVSIYREKQSHNEMRAVLSNGYVYGIYARWETKVGIGDSLSKKTASPLVEVFKMNGSKDTLSYEVLVRGWDK